MLLYIVISYLLRTCLVTHQIHPIPETVARAEKIYTIVIVS